MPRVSIFMAAGVALAVTTSACGSSTQASAQRLAPCAHEVRLGGFFSRATGSQFGGITISNTASRSCRIRGGRPEVIVLINGRRFDVHEGSASGFTKAYGKPPNSLVIAPGTRRLNGPGFRFQWFGSCEPRGTIRIRVRLPHSPRSLPVTPRDSEVKGTSCEDPRHPPRPGMAVTPLVPQLERVEP